MEKEINILLASHDQNPYTEELITHLKCKFEINQSVKAFFDLEENFDILHIQWIEELNNWQLPDEKWLLLAKQKLIQWKQRSKIIITRHNILPNLPQQERFETMYKLFYSYADAVIHLGKYSITEFEKRYPDLYPHIKHELIYHHIYESYPNERNEALARKNLKISRKSLVMLCFGKIRDKKESELIYQAFRAIKSPNKLLLAPKWLYPSIRKGKVDKIISKVISHYFLIFKRSKLVNQHLRKKDVQDYFNSADFIFIPRIQNLNSGILFIALAFGKKVLGPAVGNIGEQLRLLGLPTYLPNQPETLELGIKQIIDFGKDELQKVREKALDLFSLDKAVKKHILLYQSIISTKK